MGLRKPWHQGGIDKPKYNPIPAIKVMYGIFIGHGQYDGKFLLKKLHVKVGGWNECKNFLFVGDTEDECRQHPELKGMLKMDGDQGYDNSLIEIWF